MIRMTSNRQIKEYIRIMNGVRLDEEAKKRIVGNCARYCTMKEIKRGKFKLVAVKKTGTADNA